MANFFNSDFFRKICPIISKIFKTKVTQKNSFEVESRAKFITPPPNSFSISLTFDIQNINFRINAYFFQFVEKPDVNTGRKTIFAAGEE